jgi:hypothetical protein
MESSQKAGKHDLLLGLGNAINILPFLGRAPKWEKFYKVLSKRAGEFYEKNFEAFETNCLKTKYNDNESEFIRVRGEWFLATSYCDI